MSHYLVTGGCGFIGSHLVEKLFKQGHKVRVLDNLSSGKRENIPAQAEFLEGDIINSKDITKAFEGIEGCFHLAAIASVQKSNEEWSKTHQTNLTGTIRIFEAARSQNSKKTIPVVYVSSAAIYGDNPNLPLAENVLPQPITAYGADKLGCEHHARVASLVHKIPTLGFRLFNIYGPRQDPSSPYSGVISIFMNRLSQNQSITIYGDGQQSRDFVYVADVVRYLIKGMSFIENTKEYEQGVYNICRGHTTTIQELAETIANITGVKPQIHYAESRSGDIRHSLGDPSKLVQKFGFKAEVNLKEGLSETFASIVSQPSQNRAIG